MAYIGFQGIPDNQLEILNVESESLLSISTNKTSLQPGFLLFKAAPLLPSMCSGLYLAAMERLAAGGGIKY